MQTDDDKLAEVMAKDEYVNHYDGYKPKFVGLPEGFYRNTWGNVFFIIFMWFLIHGVATGFFSMCMALLNLNTVTVSWVFFGIFMVYIFFIITCVFIGQSKRREIERQFIDKAFKATEDKDQVAAGQNSSSGNLNKGGSPTKPTADKPATATTTDNKPTSAAPAETANPQAKAITEEKKGGDDAQTQGQPDKKVVEAAGGSSKQPEATFEKNQGLQHQVSEGPHAVNVKPTESVPQHELQGEQPIAAKQQDDKKEENNNADPINRA